MISSAKKTPERISIISRTGKVTFCSPCSVPVRLPARARVCSAKRSHCRAAEIPKTRNKKHAGGSRPEPFPADMKQHIHSCTEQRNNRKNQACRKRNGRSRTDNQKNPVNSRQQKKEFLNDQCLSFSVYPLLFAAALFFHVLTPACYHKMNILIQ